MNIASGLNNRCVDRAISTCRLLFGMNGELPVDIPFPRDVKTITRYIGRCFPNKDVFVWCEDKYFSCDSDKNVHYCGDCITWDFDDSEYIFLYTFGDLDSEKGHMVIGLPAFGYNQCIVLVIAIQ